MNPSELTREELQALREALGEAEPTGQHDARRKEYERDFAVIAGMLADDDEEPMPDHVLARLQRSGDTDWEARDLRIKAMAAGFSFVPRMAAQIDPIAPSPQRSRTPPPQRFRRVQPWLAMAAVFVVLGLVAGLLFTSADPTRPTIAWVNATDPEQKYDVWILPDNNIHKEDAEVLFVATNVRSPVKFDQLTAKVAGRVRLEKDKPHRLLVCLASAGRFAGEAVKFIPQAEITSPTPTAPYMLKKLLGDKRTKEARQLLAALPESVREDPAVLELAKQVPP